jgi:hypothetical protein
MDVSKSDVLFLRSLRIDPETGKTSWKICEKCRGFGCKICESRGRVERFTNRIEIEGKR